MEHSPPRPTKPAKFTLLFALLSRPLLPSPFLFVPQLNSPGNGFYSQTYIPRYPVFAERHQKKFHVEHFKNFCIWGYAKPKKYSIM
jgi:hypothetical protein